MLATTSDNVIHILPEQLANQIAAGEVIERPSSVVKELVENAIDAGATRIQIELHNGGMDSIQIIDNGTGMSEQDLLLSIAPHATSKIHNLDDLLNISSLGFRGEALASISSVSQWRIMSRQASVDQAWMVDHNSRQTTVSCHHEPGTSVVIDNLFYTTPARKKFLKSEQTELRHCVNAIKRIILSRFDVAFYVNHNGKEIYRFPVAPDIDAQTRRLQKLFGEGFSKHASYFSSEHRDLKLSGWLTSPEYHRQQNDQQFVYINGRVISDRVVNHAIRLALQNILPQGRQAAYVLYLEVPAEQVDVNVHPAKSEVRFSDPRFIHDFLHAAIKQQLNSDDVSALTGERIAETHKTYQHASHVVSVPDSKSYDTRLLSVLYDRYFLIEIKQSLYVLDAASTYNRHAGSQWQQAQGDIKVRTLLFPERISLSQEQVAVFQNNEAVLTELGFDITQLSDTEVMLRAIPVYLDAYNPADIIESVLLADESNMIDTVMDKLIDKPVKLDDSLIQVMLRLMTEESELASSLHEIDQDTLTQWLAQSKETRD